MKWFNFFSEHIGILKWTLPLGLMSFLFFLAPVVYVQLFTKRFFQARKILTKASNQTFWIFFVSFSDAETDDLMSKNSSVIYFKTFFLKYNFYYEVVLFCFDKNKELVSENFILTSKGNFFRLYFTFLKGIFSENK
jgi:hypothetical protein